MLFGHSFQLLLSHSGCSIVEAVVPVAAASCYNGFDSRFLFSIESNNIDQYNYYASNSSALVGENSG